MMGGEVLLLVVLIGFGVWFMNRNQLHADGRFPDSAEEMLRRRFADGEIDGEEYQRRLGVLRRLN